MINITVYAENSVDIESKNYQFTNKGDIVIFLKDLIDKIKYGGERICLESAEIRENSSFFTTIERW